MNIMVKVKAKVKVRVRVMARVKDQIGVNLVPEHVLHRIATSMKYLNLLVKNMHMMTTRQMIKSQSMIYVRYKQKKVMMMIKRTMAKVIKMNLSHQKMTHTYIRLSWKRRLSRS